MSSLSDADVIRQLTAVKELGKWSAQMYLIFSLGRADVWPVGDLAIREGTGRLVGASQRPTPKQTEQLGAKWAPYRSAMALFVWHYLNNAPV